MAATGYQVRMVMSDWTAWGAHKITAPEGAAFVVPDYRIVGLGYMAGQLPAAGRGPGAAACAWARAEAGAGAGAYSSFSGMLNWAATSLLMTSSMVVSLPFSRRVTVA